MPSAAARGANANAVIATSSAASASRQGGLALLEQCVVEAIAIIVGPEPAALERTGLQFQQASTRLPGKERLHDGFVLLAKNRAGRIEQFTTSLKDLPYGIEQKRLPLREPGQVGGTPVPADVRVPPGHPRGAAGGVQEDPVEGVPVPPLPGLRGVAARDPSRQAQAVQ